MDQIRIAADSSCDLLTMDGVDFVSVPLTVRTAVEEFRDDAALDVDAMVTTLRGTKGRTFSACPNIADWESAFGESGDVLAFTITSSLSGSCSAALAAKKRCEEQNPSRRIFVVDTLSAGPEIALLIEKSAAELRSGKSFEEVCTAVQQYQRRTHLLFALESMHNLAQNGRISKLAATMAGVLGIRAVGQASEEGTLEMLGKCRGARKTQELLLSEMVRLGYRGGSVRIGISGGGGEKLSAAWAVQLLCRTRRDYAGLCVMKTKVSDRKALLHLAVRILTLPPIVTGVTLLLMYAPAGLLTRRELLLCEVFLLVIPLAAYPLREIFHIGKDRRRGQRGTALVCSAVGYLCGFLWSMLTPCSWLVHILFLSYVISIAALLLLNVGFGLRASGHACSTTAPAFLLTWKLHPLFAIPSVLLIAAVYRSSLKLSRHTLPQLLAGSAVSLLACVISIVVYGVG